MRKGSVFVVVFALITCFANISEATMVEWSTVDGGNGHFYEAVVVPEGTNWESSIDWESAKNAAVAAGGYLATITSVEENYFVFSLVSGNDDFYRPSWPNIVNSYLNGPWIGGFQPSGSPEPDGNWQWVTGEAFTYTNWASNEPSNRNGVEDRLQLYAGGTLNDNSKWNDLPPVSLTHGYVVEYIPEPTTFLLLGLGTLALRRRK